MLTCFVQFLDISSTKIHTFVVNEFPEFGAKDQPKLTHCPISRVVSMGRRNTFLKFTRRSLKT